MKNELVILKQLETVIKTQLNNYLPQSRAITDKNVQIAFPDVDKMPVTTMFYIQPNWADYEPLTAMSDATDFNVAVFIICKKDTQSNLDEKIHEYFNALYDLLRNNISLDDMVDFVDVNNADFYPAVGANFNVKAVEVAITIRYTKDF